jgi:hypothetical protein
MSTKLDQAQCVNRTVLASTISALLAGGGAAAQAQDAALEEITITGSRIVRRDLEAASPIVTIDSARLENSSTISIESVLNQMPQFVPEGTQFDQGIQAGPTASLGIGSVNLRGIGSNPSQRPSISASSSPPGIGTSSTWCGCSCSPASTCGEEASHFLTDREDILRRTAVVRGNVSDPSIRSRFRILNRPETRQHLRSEGTARAAAPFFALLRDYDV